jgi:hypothetical protein
MKRLALIAKPLWRNAPCFPQMIDSGFIRKLF